MWNKIKQNQKWIITTIVIPLAIGYSNVISSYFLTKPPIQYVYSDSAKLDDFKIEEYFPLREGNYWVYECERKMQTPENGTEVIKEVYKIKMQVNRIYKNDAYKIIDLTGDIFNIDDERKNAQNSRFGLLVTSNKIYYLDNKKLLYLIECLKNKIVPIFRENEFNEPLFEFPLFNGQKIGKAEMILRNDLEYICNVSKAHDFYSKKENQQEVKSVYNMTYQSLSTNMEIKFIPSQGVVSKSQHHGGSVDDISIRLIEYNIDNK